MRTLTKRNNHGYDLFPKAINLFYERLTLKRLSQVLSIQDGSTILSHVFRSIHNNCPELSQYRSRLNAYRYPFSRSFLGDSQFEDEGMTGNLNVGYKMIKRRHPRIKR